MGRTLPLSDLDGFVAEVRRALIEIAADWSGDSFLLATVVERVLSGYDGPPLEHARIEIRRDSDELERLRLPHALALLFFREGELVDRVVGLISADQLASRLVGLFPPQTTRAEPEARP